MNPKTKRAPARRRRRTRRWPLFLSLLLILAILAGVCQGCFGQMSRLKKNTYVSTHTLETLCRILDCRIEDVMEVSFEDEEKENKAN